MTSSMTPSFSPAALANIEECSIDWRHELACLRAGEFTPESLLSESLDGADPDRVEGWRDYISALRAVL